MIHRYVQRDQAVKISTENLFRIIRAQIITEKATLGKESGQYFFSVALWANKSMIKQAVEHIFSVKVESVNTSRLKGKERRFRGHAGTRSETKKAMVSLKKGHSINLDAGGLA